MVKLEEVAGMSASSDAEVLKKAKEMGFKVSNKKSTISPDEAGLLYEYLTTGINKNAVKVNKEIDKKDDKKIDKKVDKKVVEKKEEAPKTTLKEKDIPKKEVPKKLKEETVDARFQTKNFRKIKEEVIAKEEEEQAKEKEKQEKLNETIESKNKKQDETIEQKKVAKKKAIKQKQNIGTKIDFKQDAFLDNVDIYESRNANIQIPDINIKEDVLKKYENRAKPTKTYQKYKQPIVPMNSNTRYRRGTGLDRKSKKSKKPKIDTSKAPSIIVIEEHIRLYQFADKISKSSAEVIKELFMLGEAVSKNDFLNNERLELLAEIFEIEIKIEEAKDILENKASKLGLENIENLEARAPTVTIMGHVDHGKTSLLDKIRNSKVADKEAGGITQHIGAYMIEHNNKHITFIDTPGHEAFSAMRARGSKITDIVIIVVAADDGVKQQTIESIKHAKDSKAPIIVAVNKIDKEDANVDLVKSGMAEQGLNSSDWGGDIDFIEVSAKSGKGINDLLDNIILQADLLECKADMGASAKAVVIESTMEKGMGAVATIILQNGSLKVQDDFVVGTTFGKIKRITDDLGKSLKSAKAGMPVKIYGLDGIPEAGSTLIGVASIKEAKEMAGILTDKQREVELSKTIKISSGDDFLSFISEGKMKNLSIVLKADSAGTLQAISDSLEGITHEEVKVNIVSKGVGGITETDLSFATSDSDTIIIGFNVRPTGSIKSKAENTGITIKTYSIIYHLIDEVKSLLSGLIAPIVNIENTGQADVKSVFQIPKVGAVAGCFVENGKVIKGGLCRVIRDGVVIHDNATITSLKRFEDDVSEVKSGYECGIMIDNYNNIKASDVIETFIKHEESVKI